MEFVLRSPCMACNRVVGEPMCVLCSLIEEAERKLGNDSPEVTAVMR